MKDSMANTLRYAPSARKADTRMGMVVTAWLITCMAGKS